MASKSGSCRATQAVRPGSRSCKAAASTPPASRSDSKSDELGASEKSTLASSHASVFTLVESTLALKYSKADLMRIVKIFSETKGQELKAKVPRKRPLKAKIPNIYFEKLHMDFYHFCQQCEDHFKKVDATGSNRTPFVALFFCGKINFWWY